MAIDVKNINCTQCGSTDVTMLSESRGRCNSCGSTFVVKTRVENQIIKNETHVHINEAGSDSSSVTLGISPRFTEEDFIRGAWIDLAREDAPAGIFDKNFDMVESVAHEVVEDDFTADVSYHVSIGYDRQEPYTAYETYYENVSYQKDGQTYYDRVRKERPVTKYRTVTDWRPMSDTKRCYSTAYAENRPGVDLDEELFEACLYSFADGDEFDDVGPEFELQAGIREETQNKFLAIHGKKINHDITSVLPGDRWKDFSISNIKSVNRDLTRYAVQEYKTKIEFNGKTYDRSTFPIGQVIVAGEKIANADSLESNIKKRKKGIYLESWQKTKKFTIFTMCLLLASAIVSFAVPLLYVTIPLFVIALVVFLADCIKGNKARTEIKERVNGEIEVFKKEYMEKLLERLNGKLASLGLEPADMSDITKGESNGL